MQNQLQNRYNNTFTPSEVIPSYQECTPEQQAIADQKRQALQSGEISASEYFGDDALQKIGDVSNQVLEYVTCGQHGAFASEFDKTVEAIKDLHMEDVLDRVNEFMARGGKIVKRNKSAAAIMAAGFLTGQFWAAAAAGGAVGVKEYVHKRKTRMSDTPEILEERVRETAFEMKRERANLQKLNDELPTLERHIDSMGRANIESLGEITALIIAGREELRMQSESAIQGPGSESEYSEDSEFTEELSHKVKILENARNTSMMDLALLKDMKDSLRENRMSMKSLLTSEVPLLNRNIATSGLAIQTLRTTSATESFRDRVSKMQNDTIKMVEEARKASERGKVDNPERMQELLNHMIDFRKKLESRATHLKAYDTKVAGLKWKLEIQGAKLLAASAGHMTKSNDNGNLVTDGRNGEPTRELEYEQPEP